MKLRSIKYLITAFSFSVTLMVFFHKLPTYVNSQVDHVVISEIQIAGSSASDEFVELYNPTGSDIIMEGWRLSRKNSAGTQANLVANLNGTIPAHGFFLITHPDVEETYGADAIYSAASNALTNNFTVLLYSDTGITLVDKVGFGEPNDFETAPFPENPISGQSIERKAQATSTSESMSSGGMDEFMGNGYDTNDNSNNFVIREVAQPQNSQSAKENPTLVSPTPEPTLTVTPTADPTPTIEPTSTPMPTLTVTPTNQPSPSPTVTQPSPTVTQPSPTVVPTTAPEPTPTPLARTIGFFNFPGKTKVCQFHLQSRTISFLTIYLPKINCFTL